MRFGSLTLHLVNDGYIWLDGGGCFGLVPKVLWEKVATPDELNRLRMATRCLYIESEGVRILVNTGLGRKLTDKQKRNFGLERPDGDLLDDLARLGVAPEDLDIVIATHLHSDHFGGATAWGPDGEAVPTFPRAEYWVQRREWADACYPNERTKGTYLPENLFPLESSGQLRLLDGDTQVTSEVRTLVTRGHTRAHQCAVLESGGQSAIYLSDLAPLAVNLERLAWIPAFDVEPLETLETKRRVRGWALAADAYFIFEHDPDVSVGRLRQKDGRFEVVPVSIHDDT
jgi:glyoxylase-like metal-dependent hydrolase (beta-lactamase superfamily II)